MIDFFTTKSGLPGIIVNGKKYHSVYDPEKEAERFIDHSFKKHTLEECTLNSALPTTVILLGEGGGYLVNAINKKYPFSRCITIFYSDKLYTFCKIKGSAAWHPSFRNSLENFLINQLNEFDLEGLHVVEWPVAASVFPEMSQTAKSTISQVIKELRGNLLTTIGMGKLWIRNSFYNCLHINSVYSGNPFPVNRPVVITASGPTLEETLTFLKSLRQHLFIVALPSSTPCLNANGIYPDMIIMTDPGYYSLYHLQWIKKKSVRLFMPLSAAAGIWRMPFKIFLFSQPAFFEEVLLSKLNLSVPSIPPQGTVAATAVQHALSMSDAPVILCGLDLCYDDIRAHARPDAFDVLLAVTASRFDPFYSQKYKRAFLFAPMVRKKLKIRTSLTLSTYEGWFSHCDAETKKKIIRFRPSPIQLDGIRTIESNSLTGLVRGKKGVAAQTEIMVNGYPDFNKRKRIVCNLLQSWISLCLNTASHIKKTSTLSMIFTNKEVFQLFYFIDLQHLRMIKQLIRTSGEKAGINSALTMCSNTETFLQKLLEKMILARGD
jgi:hypothetical protein